MSRLALVLPIVSLAALLAAPALSQPGSTAPAGAASSAAEPASTPPPGASTPAPEATAQPAPPPPAPSAAAPAGAMPPGYGYPPPGYAYGPPNAPGPGYPGYYYAPPPGAYGPPVPPAPPPEPTRSVSLTLSPIHLIFPVLEMMAEVRLIDHFSVSALGGWGTVTVDTWPQGTQKVSVYEVGGQVAGYTSRAFDGLHIGAEVLYAKAEADGQVARDAASGLAMGPFVGYKVLTRVGFTFVAQGGLEYIAVRPEGDSSTTTTKEEDSDIIPLLNLNLGWSF